MAAGVGRAEFVARLAGGLQEREVKIREGAVRLREVGRHLQVAAAGLQLAAQAAEQDDRPFPEPRVMRLAGVAQVNDERVVEHGAVALATAPVVGGGGV